MALLLALSLLWPAGQDTAPKLSEAKTTAEKREALQKLYSFAETDPGVVAELQRFIETDKDELALRLAVNVLATHRDPSVIPFLLKLADDPANLLQDSALGGLIRQGYDKAISRALQAMEEGKVGIVALGNILEGIYLVGDASVLPRLRGVLEKSKDRAARIALMNSLAHWKDRKSLPLLVRLAEDEDPGVADMAMRSLLEMAGKSNVDLLYRLLKGKDPSRRLDVAEALLLLDDMAGLDVLREAFGNPDAAVRLRAVKIAAQVRRPELVDLLVAALPDSDPLVAAEARKGAIASLEALFPYLAFDASAPADTVTAWWTRNRPRGKGK